MSTSITPYLTPAGRHEAWLRLSHILSMLPIAKAEGKLQDKFLNFERKLAAELIKQWRETYTEALKEIFKSIPSFVSNDAVKLLQDLLLDALGPTFGSSKAARDLMSKYITNAYSNSKSEWLLKGLKSSAKSPLLSLRDMKAISVLTRHNCYWLGQHYGNHIGPKIAKITQRAIDEGMGRDALAQELRHELGSVGPSGYTYWDVVASSAIVRSRSFGAISGMEEAGITEYEILAMGDERMCPTCGELDGTVFSVTETRKVIDRAIDITDPEEFKAAMPWYTEPPVGKSAAELTESGQSLPPFHGRCRCTVVMVESYESGGGEYQSQEEEQKPVIDPDAYYKEITGRSVEDKVRAFEEYKAAFRKTGKWQPEFPTVVNEANSNVAGNAVDFMNPALKKGSIRGIIKQEIDKLRGTREHLSRDSLTAKIVQEDYKRVGIKITLKEAREIRQAVYRFSSADYRDMRNAFMKYRNGGVLDNAEANLLGDYLKATEYSRVAPLYPSEGKELFRGLKNSSSAYAANLNSLKSGDPFDLNMTSSFSSSEHNAKSFAGGGGFILHIKDNEVTNGPSIRGMSKYPNEDEILIDDRDWKVTKVTSRTDSKDGYQHIWLERVNK